MVMTRIQLHIVLEVTQRSRTEKQLCRQLHTAHTVGYLTFFGHEKTLGMYYFQFQQSRHLTIMIQLIKIHLWRMKMCSQAA